MDDAPRRANELNETDALASGQPGAGSTTWCDALLTQLAAGLALDGCAMLAWDATAQDMPLCCRWPQTDEPTVPDGVAVGGAWLLEVRAGRPTSSPELAEALWPETAGSAEAYVVPLRVLDESLGALVLWRAEATFDPDASGRALIEAIAGLSATALAGEATARALGDLKLSLRSFSKHVPAVLFQFRFGPDGNHTMPFVSDAFVELYDVDPARLAENASTLLDRIHPHDRPRLMAEVEASAQSLTPVDVVFRIHRGSRTRWIRTNAQPERLADGSVIHHGVASDVTDPYAERTALERESEFRGALVALTNDLLSRDLDDSFYQHVVERAVALVERADAGSLLVRDNEGTYRFKATVGFDLEALRPARIPSESMTVGGGEAPRTVDYAGTHQVSDPKTFELLETHGRLNEIRSTLAVPVIVDGVPAAYLNLDSFERVNAFDRQDLSLTEALAAQVAMAMKRLELEQRLVHVATHDGLTGLPNRLLIQHRLEQAVASAHRHGRRLALLFLDLDGFKPINDAHGHAVGDVMLEEIAARLRKALRKEDTVARVGGDEFVVLIEDPVLAVDAQDVANKLLAVFDAPFEVAGVQLRIGASVGVALFPDDAETPERLLKAADDAMFAAKTAGRGRIRMAAG